MARNQLTPENELLVTGGDEQPSCPLGLSAPGTGCRNHCGYMISDRCLSGEKIFNCNLYHVHVEIFGGCVETSSLT